jgi:hypothetical protein
VLSEGTSGTRCDYGVLKGHPIPWGTVRGYRRGTSLLWVRRSTARAAESASGVQIPQPERADGECAELALRAHQSSIPVRAPFLPAALCARAANVGSDRSALVRARGMSGGCMFGASSGGGAAAGLLRCSQRGPRACDVTKEYSRGTPPYGVRCAGTGRGTSLLWVRRSTAERPSPLRVCSYLDDNALNGSVPSSLSALINLSYLCVAPSCQRRLRVRPRRVGSVGSAPSARRAAVGGCIAGHRVDGAAVGLSRYFCGVSAQGLKGYSFIPLLVPFDGTGCRGPASTTSSSGPAEFASGVQLCRLKLVDGQCA